MNQSFKKKTQSKKNQVGGSGGIKEANGSEKLKEINREKKKKLIEFSFFTSFVLYIFLKFRQNFDIEK
jgi:hypothetical protein